MQLITIGWAAESKPPVTTDITVPVEVKKVPAITVLHGETTPPEGARPPLAVHVHIDITVAILAQRAKAISDDTKRMDALNEIVGNADFSGSLFISLIQDEIDEIMYSGEGEEGEVND